MQVYALNTVTGVPHVRVGQSQALPGLHHYDT
jgi:hypothetical protein